MHGILAGSTVLSCPNCTSQAPPDNATLAIDEGSVGLSVPDCPEGTYYFPEQGCRLCAQYVAQCIECQ